jgi:hypothetical protein
MNEKREHHTTQRTKERPTIDHEDSSEANQLDRVVDKRVVLP